MYPFVRAPDQLRARTQRCPSGSYADAFDASLLGKTMKSRVRPVATLHRPGGRTKGSVWRIARTQVVGKGRGAMDGQLRPQKAAVYGRSSQRFAHGTKQSPTARTAILQSYYVMGGHPLLNITPLITGPQLLLRSPSSLGFSTFLEHHPLLSTSTRSPSVLSTW